MFILLQYPLCHSQNLQKTPQSKHPLLPSESSSSPVSLVLHLGGGFPKYPNNQLTDNRFFMEKSPQKNWWIPLSLYQQCGKIIESSFKFLHLWEKWSRTLPISPFCRLPKSHPVVLLPPFHRVVLIFVDSATWHEVLRWKKHKNDRASITNHRFLASTLEMFVGNPPWFCRAEPVCFRHIQRLVEIPPHPSKLGEASRTCCHWKSIWGECRGGCNLGLFPKVRKLGR